MKGIKYCTCCGKQILADSVFCPYCGKSTKYENSIICPKCGKPLKTDSLFCCYCGADIIPQRKSTRISLIVPHIEMRSVIHNKYFKIYVLWVIINCILLYKAHIAYSNNFNSSNVSRDHSSISDKGIYPEDWLYPFRNIFGGIMGQDPVYVYDLSEFILYTLIIPLVLFLSIYNRNKWFKAERAAMAFNWIVWYVSIWMLVVFPMGLFGLDFLGWSFIIGGLVICLYSYKKTFSKLYGK